MIYEIQDLSGPTRTQELPNSSRSSLVILKLISVS